MQIDHILRIQQMNHLIKIKGTGSPEAFAARLGVSRTTLYEYINLMKDLGAPIKYDGFRRTYYYTEEGQLCIRFIGKRPLEAI